MAGVVTHTGAMDEVTGVVGVVVDAVGAGDAVAVKEAYEWFWRIRIKDMKRYPRGERMAVDKFAREVCLTG